MKGWKTTVLITGIIVCVAALGMTVLFLVGPFVLQQEALPQADTRELAYRGEHIGVSKDELDFLETWYAGTTELKESARDTALESLAWRELLAYRAREAGIEMTDEEFQASVDELRTAASGAKGYAENLGPILKARGITEEEYWSTLSRERAYRQETLGAKFLEQLHEQFDRDNSGQDMKPDWNVYLQEYKKDALKNERLQKVD